MKGIKLVTICIPCYNNIDQFKRLFKSILNQSFTNFDIVITDNSTTNQIDEYVSKYKDQIDIYYYKNETNIGAIANWNKAIQLATGDWIKIMHADDYFANNLSLEVFVNQIKSGANFIFSNFGYLNDDGSVSNVYFSSKNLNKINELPMLLNYNNDIGNPSGVMIHKSLKNIKYDDKFVWKVDIEYYIQLIKYGAKMSHINQVLVLLGRNDDQLTQTVKLNPQYEIREAYILLEKYGSECLNNIKIYDSYWRTFRNLKLYTVKDLACFYKGDWNKTIVHILDNLNKSNKSKLANGFYSKIKMFQSFIQRPK